MIRKFLKSHIWIIEGLLYGIFMLIFEMLYLQFRGIITWKSILIYLFGGLILGYITNFLKSKQEKNKTNKP
jgi:predicted tellurium resistance membrane protein TerC